MLFPSIVVLTAATRVLTLGEAVRTARAQQPQLRQAHASTEAARAVVDEARGPMLPQVAATLGYQRGTANFVFRPGTPAGNAMTAGGSSATSYNFFSTDIAASQLLYDFGQTSQRWRAQGASAEATALLESSAAQQLDFTVRATFFGAGANQALVGVAEETVANMQRHLDQSQAFVAAGTRPDIDRYQARADLATARVQLINARNNYSQSRAQLNNAMGVEGPIDFEVSDETLGPTPGEDGSTDDLLAEAWKARSELASLANQARAQELTRSAIRGQYGPALAIVAGFAQGGDAVDRLGWNGQAGVTLTWSLYQGGTTAAAVREAEARARGLRAEFDSLRQQIRLQVEQVRLALAAAKAAQGGAREVSGYLPRYRSQKSLADATAATTAAAPRVDVLRPRVESNVRTLTLPASIQALEATAVYARANGYVRRWLVDIGDRVAAGQLLAEIDTPDLDQQLQQARATLGQMRASLEQARANERYAAITAGRYETLAAQHFVSRQDVDQTRAQAAVGVATVHAAQSAIAAQAASVQQLQQLKSFARVTAPFAGTITERNIDRGTLVTPGSASAKPLYTIAISNPLRAVVRVPQTFAPGIVAGTAVTVRARQYPGRDFAGRITRPAGALDAATRTLTVEAPVANDDGRLLPGTYADVTFAARLAHDVIVVPASAVMVDGQGVRVATVDGNSKVHVIPVQIGRDQGENVELVHGLTGQERVIAAPAGSLLEGTPVSVAPPPQRPAR